MTTPEARARKRAKDFSSLVWHIGVFVVVNAFLWVQDIAAGGGLEYAYWTTIPWGLGLAFHVLAYFLGDRGLEERKYEQFLSEEQSREMQSH
jgi:hypothetical protein